MPAGTLTHRRYAFMLLGFGLMCGAAQVRAVDVLELTLARDQRLTQLPIAGMDPVPDASSHRWIGEVRASGVGSVRSVSIVSPNGSTPEVRSVGADWVVREAFAEASQREARFPDGTYRCRIDGLHDGLVEVELPLKSASLPRGIRVLQPERLFSVDGRNAFVLSWETFGDGEAPTAIQVRISNLLGETVYRTAGPGLPTALPGSTTQVTLPSAVWRSAAAGGAAGLFQLEITTFRAGAMVEDAYPDAVGVTGTSRTTAISILVTEMPACGDVEHFEILRGGVWEQAGPEAVTRKAVGGHVFRAAVGACADDGVGQARILAPAGAPLEMPPVVGRGSVSETALDTAEALTARFPTGTYRFEIEGRQSGRRTSSLVLTGGDVAPLRVVNWVELQSLTNTDAVQVHLETGGGRTASDDLQLSILGPDGALLFETPGWWSSEERIPGDAAVLTVPRGVLGGDRRFEGRLRLLRRDGVDTTTFPDGRGLVGTFAETRFPIGSRSPQVLDETFGIVTPEGLPDLIVGARCGLGLVTRAEAPPVVWSLVGGALPDGLELDPISGDFLGIPSRAGEFGFTVEARDGLTNVVARTFRLRVTGAVPPLTGVTSRLPEGTETLRYCGVLNATGGVGPYRWSLAPGSGPLPRGLSLDGESGVIDGFAAESGRFPIRVQATDQALQTREKAVDLVVAPSVPSVPVSILEFRRGEAGSWLRVGALEPGSYLLEATEDWKNWEILAETNEAPAGPWVFNEAGPLSHRFFRVRSGVPEMPVVRSDVHAQLDPNRSVAAVLSSSSRVLVLTNAQGVVFTLELPADALWSPAEIRMTEAASVPDLPLAGGLLAAVALEPDGLRLRRPGVLTIRFPGGVPPDVRPFAAAGLGEDFHRVGYRSSGNEVSLSVPHFTLFGAGTEEQEAAVAAAGCDLEAWAQESVEKVAASPKASRHAELVWPFTVWFDVGRGLRSTLLRAVGTERELLNAMRELSAWRNLVQQVSADPRLVPAGGPRLADEMAPRFRVARALLTKAFLNGLREIESRCTTSKSIRDAFLLRAKVGTAKDCVAQGLCDPAFDWGHWEQRLPELLRCEVVLRSSATSKGSSAYNSVRVISGRSLLLYDAGTDQWHGDAVALGLASWNYRDNNGTSTSTARVERGGFSPNELGISWQLHDVRSPGSEGCSRVDTVVQLGEIALDFHAVGDFDLTLIPKVGDPRNFHDDFWRGPFGIAMESYEGDAGYLLQGDWQWMPTGKHFARWTKTFPMGEKIKVALTVDLYYLP